LEQTRSIIRWVLFPWDTKATKGLINEVTLLAIK
jgi:hypothetical protein